MKDRGMVQYLGMDVHKEWIIIATIRGEEQEPRSIVKKKNDWVIIRKYLTKVLEKGPILCCYEAGPCGYTLARNIEEMGITCIIAAPGLIPRKAGSHIKTDQRDAINLARNLRNGELVSVKVPDCKDEMVRDYIRMRDDMKGAEKKIKQQILGFVVRHGYRYDGTYWTEKHRKWLLSLFEEKDLRKETLDHYYCSLLEKEERLERISEKIEEIAKWKRYERLVGRFGCLKGVSTYTALSLCVEIGDFKRFPTAPQFMAYLGVIPSEHTSGGKRRLGGITKSGNKHIRQLLIESSWHYCLSYIPSKRLAERRKGQEERIIAYADRAGRRLTKKYHRVAITHMNKKIAVTAVARELAGFIWGMAVDEVA